MAKVMVVSVRNPGRTKMVDPQAAALLIKTGRYRLAVPPKPATGTYRRRDMRAEGE